MSALDDVKAGRGQRPGLVGAEGGRKPQGRTQEYCCDLRRFCDVEAREVGVGGDESSRRSELFSARATTLRSELLRAQEPRQNNLCQAVYRSAKWAHVKRPSGDAIVDTISTIGVRSVRCTT